MADQKQQPVAFDKLTDIDVALYTASAEGWRPQVGDEIRGRVLAVKRGTSVIDNVARTYPIVFVLRDGATIDDTAVAIHAFHSVLMNEFMSQRPEFGDRLFVRSLGDMGRVAPKGQDPAQIYAVHVTKPKGSISASLWDVLSNETR